MQIHLYNVEDDSRTVGKSLGTARTIEIRLKSSVDVLAPTLLLLDEAGDRLDVYNYVHIPAFNRFYFVDSVERRSNDLVELTLSVDVLETYAAYIRVTRGRYLRNIESGDYAAASIDVNAKADITLHDAVESWPEGSSIVLTTVGA